MDINKLKKARDAHHNAVERVYPLCNASNYPIDVCTKIRDVFHEFQTNEAFPTGVNINSVAAHDTPNGFEKEHPFQKDDLITIDCGAHVDGNLIDAAFTVVLNSNDIPLIEATCEGTEEAIRCSGPDARLNEIGEKVYETMTSFTMKDGTPIVPVWSLSGHRMQPYQIHAGKPIPSIPISTDIGRMIEGEVYAVETFATYGSGDVIHAPWQTSHFVGNGLPFCRRDATFDVDTAVQRNQIQPYPPIIDAKGAKVAQREETICVGHGQLTDMHRFCTKN